MPRAKNRNNLKGTPETPEQKAKRINDELEDLELTVKFQDKVKFKDYDGSITHGQIWGTNKDGSVTLHTECGSRCIMPERLKKKHTSYGPRGGKKISWRSITK